MGYRAGFGGDLGGPLVFFDSTFRPSSCPSALNGPHSHSGSSCPFSFKGWSSTLTSSHAVLGWPGWAVKRVTYSPSKNTKPQEGIRDEKEHHNVFHILCIPLLHWGWRFLILHLYKLGFIDAAWAVFSITGSLTSTALDQTFCACKPHIS